MSKPKILIVEDDGIVAMDIETCLIKWSLPVMYWFFQFSILFFFASLSGAAESVTLQLKWKHQFQFAGYYVAIEKGYYLEENLNVTLIEAKPGGHDVEDVISGRANFGVGMADILLARLKGKPVVLLADIFQHSPSILLAIKNSGISSPHDLSGKKIMMTSSYKSAELQAMLVNEGILVDKVTIVKPNWKLDDLINGKVAAIAAYISSAPYFLEKKEIPYTILSPRSYGIDFYGDNLFTSQKEIDQHPHRAMAFKKASLKGWQYAMEHPGEIIDIILSKYASGRKEVTREFLVNEASSYQKLILPGLVEIGHMNPGRWKYIADTYVKLGMVDKDYSIEGFLYIPTIPAKFDWGHWAVKSGIAIFITGMAGVLFLLFFNRRLNKEIDYRKQTEEKLINSQTLYKEVQSLAHIGHWNYEVSKGNLSWSDEIYSIFGVDKNAGPLTIESVLERIHPMDRDIIRAQVEKGKNYRSDYRIVMDDGSEKYVHEDVVVLRKGDGEIINMRGSAQDITKHKNDQEQIKASLKEKEVLLSEIHHRVKNNMQVIISLLRLQSGKTENKKYADLIKDCERRVLSMALVHEQLYQSGDFSNIDFKEYINNLINGLFILHGVDTNAVELIVECTDIFLDLDNAVPCGLIVNELVSNCLKHAFPDRRKGKINILVCSLNEDEFELSVSDDGAGISKELDIQNIESMGLHLVRVLTEDTFEGKMELDRTKGTRFNLKLKKIKYRQRI